MKIATYEYQEKVMIGAVEDGRVWSGALLGWEETDMQELIRRRGGEDFSALQLPAEGSVALEEVRLMAPIPHPAQDVICLGINYMEHAAESARFKNETFDGHRDMSVYFSKRVGRAVACGEPIPAHTGLVRQLDYESELAVIIGRDARHVRAEDASDYVFGYTIINDVSARTLQSEHKQWYFGKSLDGFCPMGPWIVTADEMTCPPDLAICSRVNGELRQNSRTSCMIFRIPEVIEELSGGMTLQAGTIIATGTPAGVGMGMNPPTFLKPGDLVECEIEGIGILSNRVEDI